MTDDALARAARTTLRRAENEISRISELSRQTDYGMGSCDMAYALMARDKAARSLAELEEKA